MSQDPSTQINTAIDTLTQQVIAKYGSKTGANLAPVIAQYGPALVKMTTADIWAWLAIAATGDPYIAYGQIVARLSSDDLATQWTKLNADWATANATNAAAAAVRRNAANAFVSAFIQIILAMVGL